MARIDNINNFLTDVADSIRTKTGKSGKISASSFDTEIASITTSENLDSELATYNTELTEQEESLSGIVEYLENKIESGEPLLLQDKSVEIVENGTTNVVADEGYDGLNSVEVNVNVEGSGGKYAPEFISFYRYKGSTLENATKNIDTSNITDMSSMFYYCYNLESLDLSSWNTSNVTTVSQAFYNCSKLANLDLSSFDTSGNTNMYETFRDCIKLESLDLSSWDTSNVTNMTYAFHNCEKLKYLDMRKADFSKVTANGSQNVFNSVPADCEIIVKDDTAREWVLARKSSFTNVKTVAELEG
jgi:surface protein